MSVKLLTEHNLELLSLTGDCTCLSEFTLVKMPHCWKSHAAAQLIFSVMAEFQILNCTLYLLHTQPRSYYVLEKLDGRSKNLYNVAGT